MIFSNKHEDNTHVIVRFLIFYFHFDKQFPPMNLRENFFMYEYLLDVVGDYGFSVVEAHKFLQIYWETLIPFPLIQLNIFPGAFFSQNF